MAFAPVFPRTFSQTFRVGNAVSAVSTIANCPFTAADATLLVNYPWTDPADVRPGSNQWSSTIGNYSVSSNAAVCDNSAPSPAIIDCSVSDGTLGCTIKSAVALASYMGVVYRYTDAANYWLAGLLPSTPIFVILETTGGTPTVRASTAVAFVINTVYTISITLSGNNMTATLDGGNQITYSSATRATVTKHGIRARSIVIADNFNVTVP